MDDIDLDYDVQEIEDEKSKAPKWLVIVSRILSVVVLLTIGIVIMLLLSNFVSWIADLTYVPTEEDLEKPNDPYTIYELPDSFRIQVIEEGVERPSNDYIGVDARKDDRVRILDTIGAAENILRKDYAKIEILTSDIEGWVTPDILQPINGDKLSIGSIAIVIENSQVYAGVKEPDKRVNVVIDKVRIPYRSENTELSPIINVKGSNIARIIRDTVLEQRIADLEDPEVKRTIVYEALVLAINKYLMGIEKPLDELVGNNVKVMVGDEVKILDIYPDKKPYSNSTYVKIRDLSSYKEGWVPINTVKSFSESGIVVRGKAEVIEEVNLKKGQNVGGFVKEGIVDIYFPKGFLVYPLY